MKKGEIESGQQRRIQQGTVAVVGTCFLMGGTWLSGYFVLMFCCNDTAKKVAGVFFILLNGAQGVFLLWVYLTRHDIGYHDVIKAFKDIFGCFSAKCRGTIGKMMFDFFSFTIGSFYLLSMCN